MTLVYIALASLLAGLVKGTSGFGSSLVALPLLTLFYDTQTVVIMMLTFNVLLNFLLHFEHKTFSFTHLKGVSILTMFGVLFTFVGIYLLGNLEEGIIRIIAFVLIVFAILNKMFSLHISMKDTPFMQAVTGMFSGLGNGIASIDGPPVVFYLTSIKADKKKFKSTLASYFMILAIMSVVGLILTSQYSKEMLFDLAYVGLFAAIGTIVGMWVSTKLNEEKFNRYVTVLLIVLAISMIV